MEIVSAVILGVIQGLTEFLPVSSSAHLILVPWFLGWNPEGTAFDVALHVGTAIAVLAFFWSDWIRLAREFFLGLKERSPMGNADRKLAWLLVVGTIPALVIGLAFEDLIEETLRSPVFTIGTLIAFGILLLVAERKSSQTRTIEKFSWIDSIAIGICQAVALVPGVSRSGITMTAALFRNSTRTAAARFSFLLSTPVIVGAGLLKALDLVESVRHPVPGAATVNWGMLGIGTLCAAVTGFLCIRYFLRYLQGNSFLPFVIYRFILAFVVFAYYVRFR